MSWSVTTSGKVLEVAVEVEKQFESGSKCAEPEETIRQAARKLLSMVLANESPATKVGVSAYGSQSTYNWGTPEETHSNSLGIKVDVLP